jgi:hypothetical protein
MIDGWIGGGTGLDASSSSRPYEEEEEAVSSGWRSATSACAGASASGSRTVGIGRCPFARAESLVVIFLKEKKESTTVASHFVCAWAVQNVTAKLNLVRRSLFGALRLTRSLISCGAGGSALKQATEKAIPPKIQSEPAQHMCVYMLIYMCIYM